MNEWNYLNETNLMQLIEDAEQNPVCKAPDYLKNQILKEAARQEKPNSKISFRCRRFDCPALFYAKYDTIGEITV